MEKMLKKTRKIRLTRETLREIGDPSCKRQVVGHSPQTDPVVWCCHA